MKIDVHVPKPIFRIPSCFSGDLGMAQPPFKSVQVSSSQFVAGVRTPQSSRKVTNRREPSSHLSPVCLSSVQLSRLFGWLGTNFSTVSANCFVFWPITIYWNQKGDWNRVFDCEMPWNAHHKFSEAPSNASIVISLNVLSPLAEWMRVKISGFSGHFWGFSPFLDVAHAFDVDTTGDGGAWFFQKVRQVFGWSFRWAWYIWSWPVWESFTSIRSLGIALDLLGSQPMRMIGRFGA